MACLASCHIEMQLPQNTATMTVFLGLLLFSLAEVLGRRSLEPHAHAPCYDCEFYHIMQRDQGFHDKQVACCLISFLANKFMEPTAFSLNFNLTNVSFRKTNILKTFSTVAEVICIKCSKLNSLSAMMWDMRQSEKKTAASHVTNGFVAWHSRHHGHLFTTIKIELGSINLKASRDCTLIHRVVAIKRCQ